MAESGPGPIRLFNDFTAITDVVALTADFVNIGNDFIAGGEGFEDSDAGLAVNETLHGGVITLTGANTDADTSFIGTNIMFDVGLMGTMVFETRVQVPDLDTKEIFFGITSILSVDEQLEDIIINASGTAVTVVADCAGFYFSDELTASATTWHGFSGGGATADQNTAATNTLAGSTVTAGEWQILRLEVDNNGTCRWYVDGDLKQTVVTAVSTTTNVAACLAIAANTTELGVIEVDYIEMTANRDWTV